MFREHTGITLIVSIQPERPMNYSRKITLLTALTAAVFAVATTAQAQGPRGNWRPDPEKVAPRLVERFDADGSGELSADELAEALSAMQERRQSAESRFDKKMRPGKGPQGDAKMGGPRLDPEERVDRWLERFDQDGDAKLDADELLAAMESMRAGPPKGPSR